MTVCPIAIAVGCKKCPAFSVCPLKGSLGDFKKDDASAGAADKQKKPPAGKGRCRPSAVCNQAWRWRASAAP